MCIPSSLLMKPQNFTTTISAPQFCTAPPRKRFAQKPWFFAPALLKVAHLAFQLAQRACEAKASPTHTPTQTLPFCIRLPKSVRNTESICSHHIPQNRPRGTATQREAGMKAHLQNGHEVGLAQIISGFRIGHQLEHEVRPEERQPPIPGPIAALGCPGVLQAGLEGIVARFQGQACKPPPSLASLPSGIPAITSHLHGARHQEEGKLHHADY